MEICRCHARKKDAGQNGNRGREFGRVVARLGIRMPNRIAGPNLV